MSGASLYMYCASWMQVMCVGMRGVCGIWLTRILHSRDKLSWQEDEEATPFLLPSQVEPRWRLGNTVWDVDCTPEG